MTAGACEHRARIAACAAAFLQNRDADDGGMAAGKHWVERVVYAFATALFQMHVHVGQGEASAALPQLPLAVFKACHSMAPSRGLRLASVLVVTAFR